MGFFETVFITHRGLVRENNEDSILIDDIIISQAQLECPAKHFVEKKRALFCVADGVGGGKSGEVASRIVLETLSDCVMNKTELKEIEILVGRAKDELENHIIQNPEDINLATTIAGILFDDNKATIFNTGDSRVYKLTNGYLNKLSKDHSIVESMKDAGILDVNIKNVQNENIITSSISGDGRTSNPEIFKSFIEIEKGDIFLICTDGLWNSIDSDSMENAFTAPILKKTVEILLQKALTSDANDNISLIVIRCVL
jgi:protein phosphatase